MLLTRPQLRAVFVACRGRNALDPRCGRGNETPAEREFMTNLDNYKRENRRPFPAWSEVLGVLGALGYRRAEPTAPEPTEPTEPTAPEEQTFAPPVEDAP